MFIMRNYVFISRDFLAQSFRVPNALDTLDTVQHHPQCQNTTKHYKTLEMHESRIHIPSYQCFAASFRPQVHYLAYRRNYWLVAGTARKVRHRKEEAVIFDPHILRYGPLRTLTTLFKCHEVLQFRGPQNTEFVAFKVCGACISTTTSSFSSAYCTLGQ